MPHRRRIHFGGPGQPDRYQCSLCRKMKPQTEFPPSADPLRVVASRCWSCQPLTPAMEEVVRLLRDQECAVDGRPTLSQSSDNGIAHVFWHAGGQARSHAVRASTVEGLLLRGKIVVDWKGDDGRRTLRLAQ